MKGKKGTIIAAVLLILVCVPHRLVGVMAQNTAAPKAERPV